MGELTVFDVWEYIVRDANDEIDWRGTFQRTADAVRDAGGGILYVPPGTYDIFPYSPDPPTPSYSADLGGVHIPGPGAIQVFSNTWVRGAGRASLLKRMDLPYSESILNANGAENVRISDLAFDLRVALHSVQVLDAAGEPVFDEAGNAISKLEPLNYVTGVHVDEGWVRSIDGLSDLPAGTPSRNVVIERCHFFNTGVRPLEGFTEHAILGRNVQDLVIRDNEVEGLQIKLGIGRDAHIRVHGNRIRDAFNCGISIVLQHFGDDRQPSIADVVVTDNAVEGSSDACLYIGLDPPSATLDPQPPPTGDYARLIIARNTLRWPRRSAGLLARMPRTASDWLIEGNLIEGDPAQGDITKPSGIVVSSQWAESLTLRLSVTNNVVRGFNLPGFAISGGSGMAVVRGNRFEGTYGSGVSEGGHATDLIMVNNVARACLVRGFQLAAVNQQVGPVLFHGNVATDSFGGFENPGIWITASGSGRAEVSLRRNVCTDTRPVGEKTQQWGYILAGEFLWPGDGDYAVDDGGDNDLSGNGSGTHTRF